MNEEVRLRREPVEGPPVFRTEYPDEPVTEKSYVAIPLIRFSKMKRAADYAVAFAEAIPGSELKHRLALMSLLGAAADYRGQQPPAAPGGAE